MREYAAKLRRATEAKLLFYLSSKAGVDIPAGDSFKGVRQVCVGGGGQGQQPLHHCACSCQTRVSSQGRSF